jgi:transposase, IS30 family
MPHPYEQISKTEREQIALRRRQGAPCGQIGKELGRWRSTIWREIRRNAEADGGYRAGRAQKRAEERRGWPRRPQKLAAQEVREPVEKGLKAYWSPEQISGRMAAEGQAPISRTTIYRHVQAHPEYRGYLRGPDGIERKRRSQYQRIRGRKMIDERPAEVEKRQRVGDWESDTMRGPMTTRACLVTHVERRTRYVKMGWIAEPRARWLNEVTAQVMAELPVHTLTVDNGMEFGRFPDLEARVGAKIYFAHEGCPWERGSNENTNGLLRQFFPRGTDLGLLGPADVRRAEEFLNNRPRKCLGYRTPKEMMQQFGVAVVS